MAEGLRGTAAQGGGAQLGFLAHPVEHRRGAAICSPGWLKAAAGANIDHRLRQRDFRDQGSDPPCPVSVWA